MKKIFVKIRDLAEGKLRGLCAGLSPEKRVTTIVVLAVLFAVGNFYMIFRAIHDIGREDAKQEIIKIELALAVLAAAMMLPVAVATARTPKVHDDQKEKQWTSMENGQWDFAPDWYYYFLHKNYSGAEMYWK